MAQEWQIRVITEKEWNVVQNENATCMVVVVVINFGGGTVLWW